MLYSFEPSAQSQSQGDLTRSSREEADNWLGLRGGNFHDRWDAAKQIPGQGQEVLADLLVLVQNEGVDWEARWFAARSLGHFDRPDVVATLIEVFCTTEDEDLREAIAQALTQIGPSAIAALANLVSHPDHRTGAIQALAHIHHPATLAPLLAALEQTQGQLKATIVEALSQFSHPDLLPVIAAALTDTSAAVRLAAIRGLISLKSYLSLDQGLAWLEPRLDDEDPTVVQQTVYALGRWPHPEVTAVLLRHLQASATSAPLQLAMVQALVWQGTQPALDGLIEAWPNLTESAQIGALQGLSRLTSPDLKHRMILPLKQWLLALDPTAANSLLRRNLVTTLGQLGGHQVKPLLQTLIDDDDSGVQLHAEAALRWVANGDWGAMAAP